MSNMMRDMLTGTVIEAYADLMAAHFHREVSVSAETARRWVEARLDQPSNADFSQVASAVSARLSN